MKHQVHFVFTEDEQFGTKKNVDARAKWRTALGNNPDIIEINIYHNPDDSVGITVVKSDGFRVMTSISRSSYYESPPLNIINLLMGI